MRPRKAFRPHRKPTFAQALTQPPSAPFWKTSTEIILFSILKRMTAGSSGRSKRNVGRRGIRGVGEGIGETGKKRPFEALLLTMYWSDKRKEASRKNYSTRTLDSAPNTVRIGLGGGMAALRRGKLRDQKGKRRERAKIQRASSGPPMKNEQQADSPEFVSTTSTENFFQRRLWQLWFASTTYFKTFVLALKPCNMRLNSIFLFSTPYIYY
ncbi:hypothetical protein BJX64DRAFT_47356 [Aspergillus heterothallicus]